MQRDCDGRRCQEAGSLNFVEERRTTIEVRADHRLHYEWKNLIESGRKERSLEARWRDPTAKEREQYKQSIPRGLWFVFSKDEPDRVRDLMNTTATIRWSGTMWLIPAVNETTGEFTGASWIVHRVDG